MKFRKFTAMLLVLLMIAGMAACGTKEEESKGETRTSTSGKADNTLTIAMAEVPVSLDPPALHEHFGK